MPSLTRPTGTCCWVRNEREREREKGRKLRKRHVGLGDRKCAGRGRQWYAVVNAIECIHATES